MAVLASPSRMALAGGLQHLELFNADSGRLDATAIADELAISTADIARSIGKPAPTVRKTPDASNLQDHLQPLAVLIDRVHTLFLSDKSSVRIWFNAPNRGLHGDPPMKYLLAGQLDVLENLVGTIELGFPS